ncbi:MAG: hypothetical protein D6731_17225 [Planctomycetota bacterium]|nr:MAG: hypothetical protein D6731_17225 [Planctomycetota bacterium]
MQPKRVVLDKVASAAVHGKVAPRVDLGFDLPARPGAVVAVRVLNQKSTYNTLEDVHGRMRLVMPGDLVAGVLGFRNALHGYVGHVPERVAPGDVLNILNLGGVIGACTSYNPDVGRPYEVEVLGAVLHYPTFGERAPRPLVIERSPELERTELPAEVPPVVVVAGTAMNAGKTTAVCALIRHLKRRGKRVAAGKCTGVSLLRDTLEMRDFGAASTRSFMDFGVVTTSADDGPPVTRAIVAALAQERPDAIILELGDGILGTYGVSQILEDPELRRVLSATVVCASDPVGAWGAVRFLDERFGIRPCALTGPVTDNEGGAAAVRREFGIEARNARRAGDELTELVLAALEGGE